MWSGYMCVVCVSVMDILPFLGDKRGESFGEMCGVCLGCVEEGVWDAVASVGL